MSARVRDSERVGETEGMRDRVTLVVIFDIEQSGNLTCSILTVFIIGAGGNRQRRLDAALPP